MPICVSPFGCKIMNIADIHADIREEGVSKTETKCVGREREGGWLENREKWFRFEREREREREEKLIKYVVQVLQVASVPSYIYDGTIARMHVICTLILKYTIFCHLQVQMWMLKGLAGEKIMLSY